MKFNTILLLGIALMLTFSGKAQEQLLPLQVNPALVNYKDAHQSAKSTSAVKLPFIDDFSRFHLRPNPSLWSDKNVLINHSFAINPVSHGVATFDALDPYGKVYSSAESFATKLDTLTSQAIRLDSAYTPTQSLLKPSDSVHLSFYVQPQGSGNKPEVEDSLILEFYKPLQDEWVNVWGIEGSSLDTFRAQHNGNYFQLFIIPVTDTAYFHEGFRFRFTNYGSIADNSIPSFKSGLYDQWNLDYVVLDKNRSVLDSSFNDVVVAGYPKTLLKDFISMPWRQFKENSDLEMIDTVKYAYRNLNRTSSKTVDRRFRIRDMHDNSTYTDAPNPSQSTMAPFSSEIYRSKYHQIYTYTTTGPDYAEFEVMMNVSSGSDLITTNDTSLFYQKFYNYYAYDDGVPEAGYGLSTANGQVALKFSLLFPDSLQSIQMYFNHTQGLASQQYFKLTVWNEIGGYPGNIIYQKTGVRPEYSDSLLNFINYKLDSAIYLSGTFYVGFEQTTSDNLNIGFDNEIDNQDKLYYNIGNGWSQTGYHGSLMIRPVIGNNPNPHIGINDIVSKEIKLDIYPNPTRESLLNIRSESADLFSQNTRVTIYNAKGQKVSEEQISTQIDINTLSSGVHYLIFENPDKNIRILKKLVVIK